VSKQDSQFFNMFSIVIGVLVAIALVLFAIARFIGQPFEAARALDNQQVQAKIAERIAPVGRVAVAGKDNSALAIVASNADAGGAPAAALPANGEETYKQVCATCHSPGIAGAPKSGDKAAWAPRIAQGTATLYKHSLEGFQGKGGVMPAKGGRADVPDELVKAAVDHMVELNR
jgi:cytochrome c5